MAIEQIRRSGYRMVGGIYLVGNNFFEVDPHEAVPICEHCGQGVNLSRNITKIKFGSKVGSYLAIVGKHFYPTPASFMNEASILGMSKRIPFLAKDIQLDTTKVYLAHPTAYKRGWGIFAYFIPSRVEKLIWQSDESKYPPYFTLVKVPDGDLDHSSWRQKKLIQE